MDLFKHFMDLLMALTILSSIQILLILAGLAFIYQCGVFIYHAGLGLWRRENGLTFGILILYTALFLGGLWTALDAIILQVDFVYGPFGLITLPGDNPATRVTPYLILSASIRLFILLIGITGNHLLYTAMRKQRSAINTTGSAQETS